MMAKLNDATERVPMDLVPIALDIQDRVWRGLEAVAQFEEQENEAWGRRQAQARRLEEVARQRSRAANLAARGHHPYLGLICSGNTPGDSKAFRVGEYAPEGPTD